MDKDYIKQSIINNDGDLKEYISELLDLNWIESESAAEGVAKKFVTEECSNLTDKQINTLINHAIVPHFHECKICGDTSWNQMSFIADNEMCSWCNNLMEK